MQIIKRNGWTVIVDICRDSDGGWNLQIDDGRGNATVWMDLFDTEQAALNAAVEAIDAEGIESFIGPASDMRYLFDA